MNLPTFDELYIISDLHLGGRTGYQIFRSTEAASGFLKKISDISQTRVGLVINGDLVDFLAEDNAQCFDTDPESAERKLRAIAERKEFAPVFEGLGQFVVKVGHQLVINLGNHDLELALPWVRRTLLDLIAGKNDAARGRITLVLDGCGFRARVGSSRIICLHGNEVDDWNVTDYEKLRWIGRDLSLGKPVAPWKPNAGSRMVVEVMNDIKKTWPFVDLLKPETETVPLVLLALNPQLGWKLKEVAKFLVTAKSTGISGGTGFLGEEEKSTPPGATARGTALAAKPAFLGEPVEEAIASTSDLFTEAEKNLLRNLHDSVGGAAGSTLMDDIENRFRAKTQPMELLDLDHESAYLGKMGDLWAATAGWLQRTGTNLKTWKDVEGRRVLRKALEWFVQQRVYDLNDRTDKTFLKIDAKVGPEFDLVVTGHTHLERALRRANGNGFYYNSGTWAGLMQLDRPTLENDANFNAFYQQLSAGSLAVLEQNKLITRNNTVVRIGANAGGSTQAELLHAEMDDKTLFLRQVPGSANELG